MVGNGSLFLNYTFSLSFCQNQPWDGCVPELCAQGGQAVNGLAEVAQGAGSALFPSVDVRERRLQGGKGRFSASSLPEPGRLRPGGKANGPARQIWDAPCNLGHLTKGGFVIQPT